MRIVGFRSLLVGAAVLLAVLPSESGAQTTRWGPTAFSATVGSFQFHVEKRIAKPDEKNPECMMCKHYLEFDFGSEEVDEESEVGSGKVDVEQLTLGYRYYGYVHEDVAAAYLGAGIGRYQLDPGDTQFGFYFRVGVLAALTCSRARRGSERGTLRRVIWDWEVNASYHRVERAGVDLDFVEVVTGPRLIFPGRHDRQRSLALAQNPQVKQLGPARCRR